MGIAAFFILLSSPVYGEIPNFHEVEEGFFRGGQPDEEGVKALKALGIQTVISFRNEGKIIRWEKEFVEKNGMTFVSIPLTWRKSPTQEEADYFLRSISEKNRPLFIHCREGKDRTGAMVALYRITQQGCPVEEAYQEAKRYGFRDHAFPLRRFILKKARAFAKPPDQAPRASATVLAVFFYLFEGLTVLVGFVGGVTCVRKPDLAMKIQKKFYEWINWEITPISMKKELRNTKILGGILLTVSFLLVVTLVMLY